MVRYYRAMTDLLLAPEGLLLVHLGDDDFGLYAARMRNSFGTSLMARGTEAELNAFLEKNKLTIK